MKKVSKNKHFILISILLLAIMSIICEAADIITIEANFETTLSPNIMLEDIPNTDIITIDANMETILSPDIMFDDIQDTNIIYNDIVNNNLPEISAEEEQLLIAESYNKMIEDTKKSVSLPEVFNLPTLFEQPSFHPFENDIFGLRSDTTPIFRVELQNDDLKRNNLISFTFDSAYINKYTYQILDILDKYDAKATFFMTYEFMKKNQEQVLEIINRGHEIGNHSTTHPDFNKVTDAKVVAEVWQAHDFIKNLVGIDMCLFRFPYGSYSPRTVTLLKRLGYYPIQWTYDSVDWRNDGTDFLIKRFDNTEFLIPGAIILFHNGATYTPEALPHIFELLESKGLKCVKVSDLIYRHDFNIDNGLQFRK